MSDTVPEEPVPSDPAPEEENDTVGVVATGGDVSEGEPPPPPPPAPEPDPDPDPAPVLNPTEGEPWNP